MIETKVNKSFNVQIWCGLRRGYSARRHDIKEAQQIVKEFVNKTKWCVTITPTDYYYVDGLESGFVAGIIQYPRFSMTEKDIISRATELATRLMIELHQNRVTITTPDTSIMLENKSK